MLTVQLFGVTSQLGDLFLLHLAIVGTHGRASASDLKTCLLLGRTIVGTHGRASTKKG